MPRTLAITIGDVNGIGPEVVLKALREWQPPEGVRLVLIAPERAWQFWQKHLQLEFPLAPIAALSAWPPHQPFALFDPYAESVAVEIGRWSPLSGKIAGEALLCATRWAREGLVQAIVTAPASKAALNAAGFHYPGQTEFIAAQLGVPAFAMLMMAGRLRVALATTHLPLRQVAGALQTDRLVETLELVTRELQTRFHIPRPRIAVTGLNPHAGEGGLLGDEENVIITPALAQARALGLVAEGPFSADALFGKMAQRISASGSDDFDAYFVMYHDQGLIPLKMMGFGRAVNYTAGLPIVRSSPDHGTAYDIAGQNVAQPSSMIEALQLAATLSI